MAGTRLTPAPEPIPKRTAKRIMGACPVAGSQRARMMMVVKVAMTIMTLKRPYLSARALGTVRPKILLFNRNN